MGRLVEAARSYIGTKWRHRGRTSHGVDCVGLVLLAYRDCGVELPDYRLYGREPHMDGLIEHVTRALGESLPPTTELQDGDVIVQRFIKDPHHVAIVAAVDYYGTPGFNVIHADGHAGRVVEVRLDRVRKMYITHVFRRAV